MFMKLVNPAGRGSRKSRRAKHRRRKARARNPFKKRRSHRRHSRRRNPFVLLKKKHHRRGRRGRRRNPIGDLQKVVMESVTNGALGGAGALALDAALAYLPIPAMLQTGPLNYVAKGGIAIGLGLGAEKLLGSARGKAVADGALTVAFHELYRAGIKQFAPSVDAKLGDVPAYYNPAPIVGLLHQNRIIGAPTLRHPGPGRLGDLRDGHGRMINGLQPLAGLEGLDGLQLATRQLAPGA